MAVSILFRSTARSHDPHGRGGGIGGANLVSDSISINIYVRTQSEQLEPSERGEIPA